MKRYLSMDDESLEDLAIENCIRELAENSGFKSASDSKGEEHENVESNILSLSEVCTKLKDLTKYVSRSNIIELSRNVN